MAAPGGGSAPEAYATLLVSDNYLPGAMVLAHSLRDAGTRKLLIALVTLDSVSGATVAELATIFDQVIPVEHLRNPSPANLYLMDRGDLSSAFTKIALWRQTQFSRIVYLDADAVVLRAPDELFGLRSSLAAVPDVGWPDIFNTGVMALTPNMGDYYALLALAQRGISFDGADQGLLNMHWTDGKWERLGFKYNCTPNAGYQYVPAYRHFQSSITVVHYIGREKPWTRGRDGPQGVYGELLGRWWSVWDKHYRYPTQGNERNSSHVRKYVEGEQHVDYSTSYHAPPPPTQSTHQHYSGESRHDEPVAAQHEQPMFDRPDPVERLEQVMDEPKLTTEQRRFEAPQTEWNPIVEPPPSQSRPEASNFPTHIYSMSEDKNLFNAPRYPSPPKDMWYQVPSTPPAQKPRALFPWEETQAPATRVFPQEVSSSTTDDDGPSLEAGPGDPLELDGMEPLDTSTTTETPISPSTPTIQVTPAPFSSYSRSNAWDDMPSISRYVEAMQSSRRGKGVPRTESPSTAVKTSVAEPEGGILSPTVEKTRRPSFKLTDFPTAVERPSLPVTPAPVARNMFWAGVLGNDDEELPSAPGVPSPQDWDPLRKLEELKLRQEEILARGPNDEETKELPSREQFSSTVPSILGPAFEDGKRSSGHSASNSGGVKIGGIKFPKSESGREEVEVPKVDEIKREEEQGPSVSANPTTIFSPTNGSQSQRQ